MSPAYPSKELAESLSEASLLERLRSTEHDFVERKPLKQHGEWLQVAVAFANSAPIGWPAVLFVGVDDAGMPQESKHKLGSLLQSISDTLDKAYPPIYRHVVPLVVQDDRACVAVVIPGSAERPHFAGKAYVRKADMIQEASEGQFDALVADRLSAVREIRKHLNQKVIVEHFRTNFTGAQGRAQHVLVDCGPHFVTVRSDDDRSRFQSFAVRRLDLSFDHSSNMLVLQTFEP